MTAPVRLGLTREMRRCLDVIEAAITKDGIPPTYDEIAEALGLRSKSGVYRLIVSLEKRGYIARLHGSQARSIMLVTSGSASGVPTPQSVLADLARLEQEAREFGMAATVEAIRKARTTADWEISHRTGAPV